SAEKRASAAGRSPASVAAMSVEMVGVTWSRAPACGRLPPGHGDRIRPRFPFSSSDGGLAPPRRLEEGTDMKRDPLRAALFLAGTLLPLVLSAQSYGDHDQVLTIGAASFRGIQGAARTIGDDGYFSDSVAGTFSYYDAPLPLPEGALIKQICEYVNDSDPGNFEYVQTYIVAVKLVPGGESPFKTMIPVTSIISTSDIGYGYYCTEPFTYTLQSKVDIDGDGS